MLVRAINPDGSALEWTIPCETGYGYTTKRDLIPKPDV